ncbi:MAG: hypothetical protein AAGA72_05620 [Pseudomonadota bacterium]
MSVEVRPSTGESRDNVAVSMALATVPILLAIAFDAAPNAEALMRECASGGSFYFDAANTDELTAAYAQIASRFNGVKIAR